jgi:hypothetical protein
MGFAKSSTHPTGLIRTVIDEELEQIFSGKQSPQAALDQAVERGNRLAASVRAGEPGSVVEGGGAL